MPENTDKDWYAMSDKVIMQTMGEFLKQARLQQNKTQHDVALASGIVRSTLALMEKGEGGTLLPYIQVMRTLGQLHLLKYFEVRQQVSPLQLAKLEQAKRERARHKTTTTDQNKKTDW
jgi:transcriptional regulator with XRE-family HTH domain